MAHQPASSTSSMRPIGRASPCSSTWCTTTPGPTITALWEYDGDSNQGGIYYEGGQATDWGVGPAWQKPQVQDYFYQNARMYLEYFNADGLRFDATTQINGNYLKLMMRGSGRTSRTSTSLPSTSPTIPGSSTRAGSARRGFRGPTSNASGHLTAKTR